MPSAIFAILMMALPPCEYEDSTNCSWDARHQGNGQGTSFVSIQFDDGSLTVYENGLRQFWEAN